LKPVTFCFDAGQRRLMVGRRIVVDQARVAELVDRRLVGRAKRMLEARDDLDVAGQGRAPRFPLVLACSVVW
jgi:hypothetical protein